MKHSCEPTHLFVLSYCRIFGVINQKHISLPLFLLDLPMLLDHQVNHILAIIV